MGGTLSDQGNYLIVSPSGNIYTTGFFSGTADLDPGVGIVNLTGAGIWDIFIQKLSQSTSGISTKKSDMDFTIYPNPNTGTFNIKSTKTSNYSILNNLGQLIQIGEFSNSNNNSVHLENLSPGIYFIVGYDNNMKTTKKFVVTD